VPISTWIDAPRVTASRTTALRRCCATVVFALFAFLAFSGSADAAPLTVEMSGAAGSGVVWIDPAHVLCQTTCQAEYADDAQVILRASAQENFTWKGWGGACLGINGDCKLTMSEARSVTATFGHSPNVRILKSGTGTGSVTSGPAGIDCGATCTAGFAIGSTVLLTATAGAGSSFTGWTGACSGTEPTCAIATTARRQDATAIFTLLPVPLTIVKQGSGTGAVTSSPAGITCGSACEYGFVNGASVTLTGIAASGSGFGGWSGGGCQAMAMTCTVALSIARTVTATFTAQPAKLSISTTGTGSGSISSAPIGILCGGICETSFADGTSVTLTATPAESSTFSGWSGACSGTSPVCTISMSAARSAVASFTLRPRLLSVSKVGTGTGTVIGSPSGIDCGPTCQAEYPHGTLVTLTAVADADAGTYFTGWTGACTGWQSTCTVSVDAAKSVIASFTFFYTLSLAMGDSGHGMVASNPMFVLCEEGCDRLVPLDYEIRLVAIPDDDSVFLGWGGACSGTGDCTITMDEAKSVTANFALLFRAWIELDGTGHGTVTSAPGGLICTDFCDESFYSPGDVTLTASAQPGSTFSGWKGACTGTSPTCVLPPDKAASVQATFDLLPVHLVVAKTGSGTGTVTSAEGSVDCGAACEADIPARKSFRLTAVAAPRSSFAGWSGECSGLTECWVWSDTDVSVTATFTADPPAPAEPTQTTPLPSPVAYPEPSSSTAPVATPPALIVQVPAAEGAVAPAARAKVAPAVRARPKLTGRVRVGRTLVCTRGTWNGSPAQYTFTWLRDGKIIARGASHAIRKADRGHSIRCVVTAKNAGGSATATSSAVRIPR
jgi:hypothetical protein